MRILLIGINFGEYEKKIEDEFRRQGHDVFYMYDSNPRSNFYNRVFGHKIAHYINIRYQNSKLREIPNSFDKVIVLVGRQLSPDFLNAVKDKNPNAEFILYLWDDVKRVENFSEVKHYYNHIYSFDLKDCQQYGFLHLPLFFTKRSQENVEKKYDIYSAMFSHSDRERVINSIANQAETHYMICKFFVCLGRFAYYKRRKEIANNLCSQITYISRPITDEENYKYMNQSTAVLDIQFSSQIGLTMRTIESLGMGNKIITTNPCIKYYDFYCSDNIMIIDREKPVLDYDFFNKQYKPCDTIIYEKYSLMTWVKTLSGETMLNDYINGAQLKDLRL